MNTLPQDIQRYCGQMEEVNLRLKAIDEILSAGVQHNGSNSSSEQLALQFRKILELIAFGTLIANRETYSTAHSDYISHWKAKDLLQNLEAVNPAFYPVPLKPPVQRQDGSKHFDNVSRNYLTRDQFMSLYDLCGSILHTHNPYSGKKAKQISTEAGRKWAKLVKNLLALHLAKLVAASECWVVVMHDQRDSRVHAFRGDTIP